jgi:hypothetical protein
MKSKGHASYKNEVDEPAMPAKGHKLSGMGCHDFKGEAMDIAYGQAGAAGCKSDYRKIESQMKHYGWDSGK